MQFTSSEATEIRLEKRNINDLWVRSGLVLQPLALWQSELWDEGNLFQTKTYKKQIQKYRSNVKSLQP